MHRPVFFYDNLGVFVAYKVVGRDPAIGFRGVGINEARHILKPPIRRGREIRKMVPRLLRGSCPPGSLSRSTAEVYSGLRLHRLPVDDSVGY